MEALDDADECMGGLRHPLRLRSTTELLSRGRPLKRAPVGTGLLVRRRQGFWEVVRVRYRDKTGESGALLLAAFGSEQEAEAFARHTHQEENDARAKKP